MYGLRFRAHLLTLLLLAFLGTGVSQQVTTLDVVLKDNAYIFDPTAHWLYDVAANMFVPLVDYDYETSEVLPAGATSWTVSEDGKTYTFNIREDWTWSDGRPVTASDYGYAFKRILDPNTAAPMAYRLYIIKNAKEINTGEITDLDALGVEAINDTTLKIELTEPASWFLTSLASIGHAVPRWVIEEYGREWTNPANIVVNGPYILTELKPEDLVVLEKNPSYYDASSVQIEKINLYAVDDPFTAMTMYETGVLDTVSVAPQDLTRVKSDPELSAQYYNGPTHSLYYYFFNVLEPPFDDVLVRKAFAAAVDKQAIVEFITRGGEIVAPTLTPPGSVGHVPTSADVGIPYDPERAQGLLAEAGYPSGQDLPKITLAFNAGGINDKIAQAIQQMWKDTLGAEVELQPVEGAAYSEIAAEGAFNVWRMGWGMDYPDANNIHAELFHSNVGSPAILKSSEYDRLIDKAAVESDPEKRVELYKQAEQLLVEDMVGVIPLYWGAENILTRPYLQRELSPSFNRSFWKWSINQ